MNIKQQLEADIKQAMLSGDKIKVTTLRGLKSSILNAEVASNSRDSGLPDDQVLVVFSKEAKKRQEAADLYIKAGNEEKAQAELTEREIIASYLPAPLTEAEVLEIMSTIAEKNGISQPQQMGQLIGLVKAETKSSADGAMVARLVKEYLNK